MAEEDYVCFANLIGKMRLIYKQQRLSHSVTDLQDS